MFLQSLSTVLVLVLLFLTENFASAEIHFKKGAPYVSLSNNAELSGSLEYSRDGRPFNSFIGVPFGTIPGRFEEAQPAPAWEGVHDATKQGQMCVQGFEMPGSGNMMTVGDEDCLNLNVYVPMNNTQRKGGFPVMVWVHGGGFSVGVGIAYGPKFFMDEDVILVTFNYRLGAFGFLSTGDSAISGNYGMKDQVLALEWVKEHIRNFGGNPEKVTVFGESAGGASVHYLVLSPTTNGLFQQAIMQSGSTLAPWAYNPNPRSVAVRMATQMKCPASSSGEFSSEEIAACMKKATPQELNEATFAISAVWPPKSVSVDFVPVKEPKSSPSPFLTESPWSILTQNTLPQKNIPMIIGNTQDEGIAFPGCHILNEEQYMTELDTNWDNVILPATQLDRFVPAVEGPAVAAKIRKFYFGDKPVSKELRASITNMFSDAWFVYSGYKGAVQTARKGSPVYLYQYAHHGPAAVMKLFGLPIADEEASKVGHGDDCLLQFNLDGMLPAAKDIVAPDSEHETFSKNFIKLWTSFAATGKPSHSWPGSTDKWSPISKSELKENIPLAKWYRLNYRPGYFNAAKWHERVAFWDQLYKDHILASLLSPSSSGGKEKTEL